MEFFTKEVDALLPPKLGESSTNKPKEEWQDEVFMRLSKFMKGGGCKESFTALGDCFEETQSSLRECNQHIPVLLKCMVAHSRYYQPIVVVAKTAMEEILFKDAEELAKRKQAEKLNQLPERKQAKGYMNYAFDNHVKGEFSLPPMTDSSRRLSLLLVTDNSNFKRPALGVHLTLWTMMYFIKYVDVHELYIPQLVPAHQ